MPDPDGKTGQIEIQNRGGIQIIDKPGYATEVIDEAVPPKPPRPIDEKELRRIFGGALTVQPVPPVTYILYFTSGTSVLTAESEGRLPEIITTALQRKSSDISVVGHSDTVGTKQKNYEISFDRARMVKEILVLKGIDPLVIKTESHGEDNPFIKTPDEVAEPRNRRVEVTIR
jgi:outer membrane protein OmpA-like peptidoglycan-associated protein